MAGSCQQKLLLLCKVGNFSYNTATERQQPCDTLHIPCFPIVGRPRRPNQRRNRLAVVTSGRQPGATSQGVAGRWCSCSSSTVRLLGSCSRLHGDIGHWFCFSPTPAISFSTSVRSLPSIALLDQIQTH